jgi:hypothetical protein
MGLNSFLSLDGDGEEAIPVAIAMTTQNVWSYEYFENGRAERWKESEWVLDTIIIL